MSLISLCWVCYNTCCVISPSLSQLSSPFCVFSPPSLWGGGMRERLWWSSATQLSKTTTLPHNDLNHFYPILLFWREDTGKDSSKKRKAKVWCKAKKTKGLTIQDKIKTLSQFQLQCVSSSNTKNNIPLWFPRLSSWPLSVSPSFSAVLMFIKCQFNLHHALSPLPRLLFRTLSTIRKATLHKLAVRIWTRSVCI